MRKTFMLLLSILFHHLIMKKSMIIMILGFMIFASSCAHSPTTTKQKWDTTDKTLYVGYIVSSTIDCFQTKYIFKSPEYRETNEIIVKGVDRFGDLFIPLYFSVGAFSIYVISNQLSSPYRKALLSLCLGTSLWYINHNNSIGINLAIPF